MAQKAADQITLVDLTDGYTVFLDKYAHIFPGNTTNALAGSISNKVTAMVGGDIVPCSVDISSVTKPTGVTVTKDTNTTTPTLMIAVTTAFNEPGVVTIPVEIGDVTVVQSMAISFAKTGATGTSATIMGLKNEAHMIVTDSAGKTISASTIQVDFYGYVGSSRRAITASVGSLPSGLSVGTNTPGTTSADGVLSLSVAANSTLGGTDNGTIPVTLSCNGQTIPLSFAWSKAKAGVNGTNGKDAISLELESSNGMVFKNSQAATTLTANVYKGGVLLTSSQVSAEGTIKWYKDGSLISGATGTTYIVTAGAVNERATYQAKLE